IRLAFVPLPMRGADSSTKCNAYELIRVLPKLNEVEGAFGEEEFSWGLVAEGYTDTSIEQQSDLIELILGEAAQVLASGEELPEQAIDVFVDAALPGGMGMSEVDIDARLLFEPAMLCHLSPLVIGEGFA